MSTFSASSPARTGVLATATAFFIWGLLPLYLKPLHHLSALDISAWRGLMGCVTVLAWLAWRGELPALLQAMQQPAIVRRLAITAALLAVNWTFYAWGVTSHQVLMTSLGYFINPLVNVVLGVLLLSEKLNRRQWLAVGMATTGVLILTFHAGEFPWLALLLAISFSLYGLLRKTCDVAPLIGLGCETLLATPLALGWLVFSTQHFGTAWPDEIFLQVLVLLSGVLTMLPLALFNFGARLINYSTVGMLQYIGPSLQFIIGIVVFKESLNPERLLCFGLIWLALVIYMADVVIRMRKANV